MLHCRIRSNQRTRYCLTVCWHLCLRSNFEQRASVAETECVSRLPSRLRGARSVCRQLCQDAHVPANSGSCVRPYAGVQAETRASKLRHKVDRTTTECARTGSQGGVFQDARKCGSSVYSVSDCFTLCKSHPTH